MPVERNSSKAAGSASGAVLVEYYTLPESAYALWARGELGEWLRPREGDRVEVVGGHVVVSGGVGVGHEVVVAGVAGAVRFAGVVRRGFGWEAVRGCRVELAELRDGYLPDLVVRSRVRPEEVAMVVEVTSPETSANDCAPGPRSRGRAYRRVLSKWVGYAYAGVPYYLLVDRHPQVAHAVLYSEPDVVTGRYCEASTWVFGETIRLPAPFDFVVETGDWQPWD